DDSGVSGNEQVLIGKWIERGNPSITRTYKSDKTVEYLSLCNCPSDAFPDIAKWDIEGNYLYEYYYEEGEEITDNWKEITYDKFHIEFMDGNNSFTITNVYDSDYTNIYDKD